MGRMAIDVTLTNRFATLPVMDDVVYKKLRDFWSYSPKGLWYMPKYKPTKILLAQRRVTLQRIEDLKSKRSLGAQARIKRLEKSVAELDEKLATMWDGRIQLLQRYRLSAGLFRATWREAEQECGVKFTVTKRRDTVDFMAGLPAAEPKYEHQNACVRKMVRAVPKGGGIVLAATASGKTAIAARMFSNVNCECLFVVDQLDLLHQQKQELEDWLHEAIGFVGESIFQPGRVTVATIQTLNLYRNTQEFRRWYSNIDVLVVDELHEQMGRRNFNVLEAICPVAVFGLTATLQMKHKETRLKAYAFAGPVIYTFPIKEGVARGVLAKGYALQLLFPEGSTGDLSYQEDLRAQVTENSLKFLSCRALVRELLCEDRHVVALVERVPHLEDLSDTLRTIPHGVAYGKVDVHVRQELKQDFEREDVRLILANKVFKKGINIKRVDAMIDMAEGKSKNDPVQKFGRGLRLHPQKDELIYIDFGTAGKGRFAKAAARRRKALREAGVDVQVIKVCSIGQALHALKIFMRKVTDGSRRERAA